MRWRRSGRRRSVPRRPPKAMRRKPLAANRPTAKNSRRTEAGGESGESQSAAPRDRAASGSPRGGKNRLPPKVLAISSAPRNPTSRRRARSREGKRTGREADSAQQRNRPRRRRSCAAGRRPAAEEGGGGPRGLCFADRRRGDAAAEARLGGHAASQGGREPQRSRRQVRPLGIGRAGGQRGRADRQGLPGASTSWTRPSTSTSCR